MKNLEKRQEKKNSWGNSPFTTNRKGKKNFFVFRLYLQRSAQKRKKLQRELKVTSTEAQMEGGKKSQRNKIRFINFYRLFPLKLSQLAFKLSESRKRRKARIKHFDNKTCDFKVESRFKSNFSPSYSTHRERKKCGNKFPVNSKKRLSVLQNSPYLMCWNTLYYTRVEKCARREFIEEMITCEWR